MGTSHKECALPCQDSQITKTHPTESDDVLIFVCSDGAGSATHSDVGSRLACERFATLATDYVMNMSQPDSKSIDIEQAKLWMKAIRCKLEERAVELGIETRELACTIVGGIIFDSCAVFMQIGDGAIVVRDGKILVPVFWPQSGEYVNTTNFLTDNESENSLDFRILMRVDQVAAFTDGLERLLLRFDDKTVHQQALTPMLEYLQAAPPEQIPGIEGELSVFLDSPQVNARTDDDKTLILATRITSDASVH